MMLLTKFKVDTFRKRAKIMLHKDARFYRRLYGEMSEHASHHTNVQTAKKLTEKRDAFVDAFAQCCISHISYCFLAFSLLPPSQFRKVALVEGNYKPRLRHAAVVFL